MDRPTIRALLVAAAVLDAGFPAVVIALDIAEGTDAWATTLSLHARRPGFPWMTLAFLTNALSLAILAAALRRLPPRPYAAPVCLLIGAAASALLSLFAADAHGNETVYGHIHEALAPFAFLGIAAGGVFAAHAHRSHPAWRHHWKTAAIFAWLLVVACAVLGLLVLLAQAVDAAHGYYGAAERLVVVAIGGWIVSTAVQGTRVTLR